MKVLFASSEIVPFAKTGGLADVSASLPAALAERGHEVRLFTPFYKETRERGVAAQETGLKVDVPVGERVVSGRLLEGALPGSGVPVYFLDAPEFYDRDGLYGTSAGDHEDNCSRFIFFARGLLEAAKALGFAPDVIHLNDWQTALAAVYRKTLYAEEPTVEKSAVLLTIHNLAYQGVFWHLDMPLTGLDWSHFNWKELEHFGKINFLKGGIVFADSVNTVSPTYAEEIRTAEFGAGLDGVLRHVGGRLSGIINGVDYAHWNPETDELLPARYSASDLSGKAECKKALQAEYGLPQKADVPVIGIVGRLAAQKGLDLVAEAMGELLELPLQLIILGTGEEKIQNLIREVAAREPERIGAKIAFDNRLAHLIEAGSDVFLMPSRYEPCGLNQMYSLKYGTVPLVRATGGLADTITDCTAKTLKSGRANGFSFTKYESEALVGTIERALKLYRKKKDWVRLVSIGMKQDWSWDRSAQEYEALYGKLGKSGKSGKSEAAGRKAAPKAGRTGRKRGKSSRGRATRRSGKQT